MLADAKTVIRECEERLRVLMAKASAAGQYDAVDTITDWARTISRLIGTDAPRTTTPLPDSQLSTYAAASPSSANRRPKSKSARSYPRFIRSGTELVKIGWSKKEKKEYQHRAPWAVVELLCHQLNAMKADGFTSDDVLPLIGDGGLEVPSYQSYLCLAWLRESGLITKEGRQGYSVPKRAEFIEESRKAWKNLPQKR